MSATVLSDFGLYKETTNQKKCLNNWTYSLVGVGAICLLFLFTLFAVVATKVRIQKLERLDNNVSVTPQRFFLSESPIIMKNQPRPFQVSFDGSRPTFFSVTSTEPSLNGIKFYQFTPYGRRNFPESIQEIIGHVSSVAKNKKRKNESDLVLNNHQIAESNYQENFTHQGFKKNDPFQEFKPLHPGEVNLMAVANFRFSPPAWKSFSSKYQRDTLSQQFIPSSKESFKPSSGIIDRNKPLSLTFSVLSTEQVNKNLMYFLKEMELRLRKSKNDMMTINVNVEAKT